MERAFKIFLSQVDFNEEHAELYKDYEAAFLELWNKITFDFEEDADDSYAMSLDTMNESFDAYFRLDDLHCVYDKRGQLQEVDKPLICTKRHVHCDCYFKEFSIELEIHFDEVLVDCELKWEQDVVKIGNMVLFREPTLTKQAWQIAEKWDTDATKEHITSVIKRVFFYSVSSGPFTPCHVFKQICKPFYRFSPPRDQTPRRRCHWCRPNSPHMQVLIHILKRQLYTTCFLLNYL